MSACAVRFAIVRLACVWLVVRLSLRWQGGHREASVIEHIRYVCCSLPLFALVCEILVWGWPVGDGGRLGRADVPQQQKTCG